MKKNFNEFLLAIYLFLFAICKIFIRYFTGYSTFILLGATSFILLVSILYNIKQKQQKIFLNKNFIIIILTVLMLFLTTMIFNNNVYVGQQLYEFLIYGIFTMYLFTNIKNYKEFLRYYANISIFVILLYGLDPFNNFNFFIDYMSFGLTCMLPAFCACCIGRNVFKKKIYFVFEVIAFLEILLFCNRGALLVAIVLEVVLYLVTTKLNAKKIAVCIISTVIAIVILLNIESILLEIIYYLDSNDLDSYSIHALYNMILGENSGMSGRDTIWQNAINYFKESWIWGHGIGGFQNEYGGYTHNLFLEILTNYGILGMSVFIILFSVYLYKIFKCSGYYRIILIMFLVMGIFPLLLSIYTYKWQYFWCFVIIATRKIPKEYKKKAIKGEEYEEST